MKPSELPKKIYFISKSNGYYILYRKNSKGTYSYCTLNSFSFKFISFTLLIIMMEKNRTISYTRVAEMDYIEDVLYFFTNFKDFKYKYPEEFI